MQAAAGNGAARALTAAAAAGADLAEAEARRVPITLSENQQEAKAVAEAAAAKNNGKVVNGSEVVGASRNQLGQILGLPLSTLSNIERKAMGRVVQVDPIYSSRTPRL